MALLIDSLARSLYGIWTQEDPEVADVVFWIFTLKHSAELKRPTGEGEGRLLTLTANARRDFVWWPD